MLLAAKGLSVYRGDEALFQDLDISLAEGEIVRLEGSNGSGKTTLLRLLCGLGEADDGELFFRDKPMNTQMAELREALIFLGHKPGINGSLTGVENLAFLSSLEYTVPEAYLREALAVVGLASRMDLPCRVLSAGQKRRVALARLLVTRARIWILDEPLTALDAAGRDWLEQLLIEHAHKGGSAVITTHQDFAKAGVLSRSYRLTAGSDKAGIDKAGIDE